MPYKDKSDLYAAQKRYRERQCEKDAQRREQLNEAYDLMEEFVRDEMEHGRTREQAETQFHDLTTQPGETQPVNEATDSVPETKPDCFGKKFHKDSEKCDCSLSDDCHKAWVAEMFKPRVVKEAERTQKMIDWLAESKALVEGIERRESAELWAKVKVIEDAEEREFDAAVKKYTDQGIPEKTAIESCRWEQKRQKAEVARQFRETMRKRELMTEEEKTAEKLKIFKDSKKLLKGDTPHE
jgi:hypothetical protein